MIFTDKTASVHPARHQPSSSSAAQPTSSSAAAAQSTAAEFRLPAADDLGEVWCNERGCVYSTGHEKVPIGAWVFRTLLCFGNKRLTTEVITN